MAPDSAVLLSEPIRVFTALHPGDIEPLLAEVQAEQLRGNYVAGYVAYEAGAAYRLAVRRGAGVHADNGDPGGALAADAAPLAWMAVYSPATATIVSAREWAAYLRGFDVSPIADRLQPLRPDLSVSEKEYEQAIATVREYIAAGDTYQVNYTVRARYDLARRADDLDPLDYFLSLVIRQSVPYAAYLDLGDRQVISLSPELFLRRDGDMLESRPMKGTRPRYKSHAADVAVAYELAETEKERAENLMIVDMVRNDLGRVCRTGSVHVPTLFAVEPYRTVWQMTSTVQGELQPETALPDIMRAVFPGASITGAPKHHTMEIIAQVETEPRGVYTGTVALFSPGTDFVGNIAIRTILHREGRCVFGVGSGVVWDATAPAEYEETLAKAAFALAPSDGRWLTAEPEAANLFETMLFVPGRGYRDVDGHLSRLAASARALGFRLEPDKVQAALAAVAASAAGPLVVRLELEPSGAVTVSTREAPELPDAPVRLLVSPFRVDPNDSFVHHKTTRRAFYDREHGRAVAQGCFDAVFVNLLDHVTEGGITNIFARFGDVWSTPPEEDGLLPGVWRAVFAAETGAVERSLTLSDLARADEVVVGNSVRGKIPVSGLVADPLVF